MILLETGSNGEVMVDGLPYQKGQIKLTWDKAAQTMGIVYLPYPHDTIVTQRGYAQYGDGSGAFANFAALVAFVRTAFFLVSGAGAGGPVIEDWQTTGEDPALLNEVLRIVSPGLYTNMQIHFSDGAGGTVVIAREGAKHADKSAIVQYIKRANCHQFGPRQVLFEDATEAGFDPGAGINTITGTCFCFINRTIEEPTNPGFWTKQVGVDIIRSTDKCKTWALAQTILLAQFGVDTLNAEASASGTLQTLPDGSIIMTFYGGSSKTGFIYESTDDGLTWTYKERIDNGGAAGSEFVCKNLPGSHAAVAFSRNLTTGPAMYIRDETVGGSPTAWVYAGIVTAAAAATLVYGAEISPDGTQLIAVGFDRSHLLVTEFRWNVSDIIDAYTNGTEAGMGAATVFAGSLYMSSLRSKDPSNGGYNGNGGNPTIAYCNTNIATGDPGQLLVAHWEISELQAPPYRGAVGVGYDLMEVQIKVYPHSFSRSFLKAGQAVATDAVGTGAFLQIPIINPGISNGVFSVANNAITVLEDCEIEGYFSLLLACLPFGANCYFTGKVEATDLDANVTIIGANRTYLEVYGQPPSTQLSFAGSLTAGTVIKGWIKNDSAYTFTIGENDAPYDGLANGVTAWTVPAKQIARFENANIADGVNAGAAVIIPAGDLKYLSGYIKQVGNAYVCIKDCNLVGRYIAQVITNISTGNRCYFQALVKDGGDGAGRVQVISSLNVWHPSNLAPPPEYLKLPEIDLRFSVQLHAGDSLVFEFIPYNGNAYSIAGANMTKYFKPEGLEMFVV